jgi:hypothetical protein
MKKKKKSSLSPEALKLAQRYEKAWHELFYKLPRWKQESVIAEPHDRTANELAKQVRIYVDTDEDLRN